MHLCVFHRQTHSGVSLLSSIILYIGIWTNSEVESLSQHNADGKGGLQGFMQTLPHAWELAGWKLEGMPPPPPYTHFYSSSHSTLMALPLRHGQGAMTEQEDENKF